MTTLLRGNIAVMCPVRILHGVKDERVSYFASLELITQLLGNDLELAIKDEDHYLLQKDSLDWMVASLRKLLKK